MSQLVDQYHRIATNLRVSVTDVCNLRCLYCMPEEMDFAETDQIMTFEEIIRLVNIAVGLGVNKVRLTGGEPLVRRGLPCRLHRCPKSGQPRLEVCWPARYRWAVGLPRGGTGRAPSPYRGESTGSLPPSQAHRDG